MDPPELKTNYESRAITQENIGTVFHPIDAARIREIERGEKGIIPILFSGSSHDAFSYFLKHLKVRVFNDESYFNSFFSLLKDIHQLPSDSPLSAIREEFMSSYK